MKAFYPILFSLLTSVLFVNAQTPDSIAITTDGSWIIEHSETDQFWNAQTNSFELNTTYSYKYFRSGNDTIINSTTYTQLLETAIIKNPDGTFYSNTAPYEFCKLSYRNDMDKRAFMIKGGTTAEEAWYDFNYAAGDTIWNPNTLGSNSFLVISSMDSIDYCGNNYERLNFVGNPHYSTQRVGSTINFLGNYQNFMVSDKIISFCESSIPFEIISAKEEINKSEKVTISPNPAKNIFNISTENGNKPLTVTIYSLTGKIVLQDYSGKNSFSVSDLNNGIYLVSMEFSNYSTTAKLIKN